MISSQPRLFQQIDELTSLINVDAVLSQFRSEICGLYS